MLHATQFWGGIRTLKDFADRIRKGADKCVINTKPLENPSFIDECAKEFGSQCVVVCIDVRRKKDKSLEVFAEGGRLATGRSPVKWAKEAENRGAGELLIQSIDRDGSDSGYDIPLIKDISTAVSIPVIALGGVGKWEHFVEGIQQGGADAVAAANIFNYSENSVYKAKEYLFNSGLNVRNPTLGHYDEILTR